MTIRTFIKAVLACFQGNKDVVPEINKASQDDLAKHRRNLERISELRVERLNLTRLRTSLRRRKKKFTHLDPRLQEITTELLGLERGG